jgi:hypothetical protein
MLIGGAGRDAERVAEQIATRPVVVWNGTVGELRPEAAQTGSGR